MVGGAFENCTVARRCGAANATLAGICMRKLLRHRSVGVFREPSSPGVHAARFPPARKAHLVRESRYNRLIEGELVSLIHSRYLVAAGLAAALLLAGCNSSKPVRAADASPKSEK